MAWPVAASAPTLIHTLWCSASEHLHHEARPRAAALALTTWVTLSQLFQPTVPTFFIPTMGYALVKTE